MRRAIPIIALSAAMALTGLSAAYAQGPGGGRGPGAGGPGQRPPAERQAEREAAQRQRQADLKTILRIRPNQEAAFTAFVQSMRPPARPAAQAAPQARPATPPTTLERLDRMEKRRAERESQPERRAQALRTFYTALDADQRQVFDAMTRLRGGPGLEGGDGPGQRRIVRRFVQRQGPGGGPGGMGPGGMMGPRGPGGQGGAPPTPR